MGSVVSSAANGVGTLVGNVVSAPFKLLFGASCESVCSGTWDLPCFVEHVCISSLLRLFVVIIVTYIVLLFGYVLCKLGIVKCVAKNVFKMVRKPCSACCRALGLIWEKVRDTKRVHRGRRGRQERDVELGEPSSTSRDDGTGSSSSSDDDDGDRCWAAAVGSMSRGRSLSSSSSSTVRERRKDRIRQSLRLKRISSKVERAARVSQGRSGRQHRHSTSIGPRRTEAPPSLSSRREHGHGSPARGHKHAHGRTLKSSHGDSTRQHERDAPSVTDESYSTDRSRSHALIW